MYAAPTKASTVKVVSSPQSKKEPSKAISGNQGLKSTVFFAAQDSVIYHLDRRTMELFGQGVVTDAATSVKAPKITIDLQTSELRALSTPATSSTKKEVAQFSDKQGSFTGNEILYNFNTKQGSSTTLSSVYGGVHVTGKEVTKLENGKLKVKDGTFTTCNETEPHYWFASPNMEVTPEGSVTAMPLYMYMRPELFSLRLPAVPMLVLPYMSFSTAQRRESGILLPHLSNYDNSTVLSGMGYYWAINDYTDLRTDGDIAQNGSWRLGDRFRYVKRNVISGEVSGEYHHYALSDEWNVQMRHNQTFNPTTQLDANLAFSGGERRFDLNTMNAETLVSEQTNAHASFAKTFDNNNALGTLTYNGAQDLRTHNGTHSVSALWYENRRYLSRPLAADNDWRSNVSLKSAAFVTSDWQSVAATTASGYNATAMVEAGYYKEFSNSSKALFTQGAMLQMTQPITNINTSSYTGSRLLFPLRMQASFWNYFNINPTLTLVHSLRTDGEADGYTTAVASVDARTRLYGTWHTAFLEPLLGVNALRHTFVPTISYTWNPSFTSTGYPVSDPYYGWAGISAFYWYAETRYTGLPEGQSSVGITLKNLFHARLKNAPSNDSEHDNDAVPYRSVELLSLSVSGTCNFAAEAYRISPLTLNASSSALSPWLLLNSAAMYDVYSYDPLTGKRAERFNSDDGRGLLRFVKGFAGLSVTMQKSRRNDVLPSTTMPVVGQKEQALFADRFRMSSFSVLDYTQPWQLALSLYLYSDKSNPLQPSSTTLLNTTARVALSHDWQAGFTAGYDVDDKKIVFPMMQAYHDLHCWQLGFQWVPVGEFKGYSFMFGLKNMPAF